MSELLTRMLFGGFARLHVLHHVVKEPVFGVEMMEALGRHGYDVGAGTLYPMLHQLEEAGYLASHLEVVVGKRGNKAMYEHALGSREVGLTVCYSRRKAADKPSLRPQIPAQPASGIMNFNPRANWSL